MTTKFEVEMCAFLNGTDIREVEILNSDMLGLDQAGMLDLIFLNGQNEVQPLKMPSVSMGDIIRFNGKRFLVDFFGFKEV